MPKAAVVKVDPQDKRTMGKGSPSQPWKSGDTIAVAKDGKMIATVHVTGRIRDYSIMVTNPAKKTVGKLTFFGPSAPAHPGLINYRDWFGEEKEVMHMAVTLKLKRKANG